MRLRMAQNWQRAISGLGDTVASAITTRKKQDKLDEENARNKQKQNLYLQIANNPDLSTEDKYSIIATETPDYTDNFMSFVKDQDYFRKQNEERQKVKQDEKDRESANLFSKGILGATTQNPLFPSQQGNLSKTLPMAKKNGQSQLYSEPVSKTAVKRLDENNFDDAFSNLSPGAQKYVSELTRTNKTVKEQMFPKQEDPYEGSRFKTEWVRDKSGSLRQKKTRVDKYGNPLTDKSTGKAWIEYGRPINATEQNPNFNDKDAQILSTEAKKILSEHKRLILSNWAEYERAKNGIPIMKAITDKWGIKTTQDVSKDVIEEFENTVDDANLFIDSNLPQAAKDLITQGQFNGIKPEEFAKRAVSFARDSKYSYSKNDKVKMSETSIAIELLKNLFVLTYGMDAEQYFLKAFAEGNNAGK